MKRFLAVLMMLCVALPLLIAGLSAPIFAAVEAVVAALTEPVDRDDGGLTFNGTDGYADDFYQAEKKLEAIPHTFEAWVFLPTGSSTIRPGVILGNCSGFYDFGEGEGHISFEIQSGNRPRLQWYDENSKSSAGGVKHEALFGGDAVLTENAWHHVVIVHDDAAAALRCYVDGTLVGTNTASYAPIDNGSALDFAMSLGGDTRTMNPQYFKGALQDVTLYADVRTQEEIEADMNGVDLSDEDLLLHYDIDSSDKGTTIVDESGNGYDQYYSSGWLTEEEMENLRGDTSDRAYSFAVIGDTQYSTQNHPDNLAPLYQWIVDNKEEKNIQYALGLGDITNGDTLLEWYIAKQAISIMDGKVEYSLIRGNHDFYNTNNPGGLFDTYFADDPDYVTQFEQYGGFFEKGSVANTYRTLRIGQTDWLLLNLDWGPTDDVLDWAGEVIASYPDHKVIISTHAYLYADGTTLDCADPSPTRNESKNNGDAIWNKLASRYANVEMVLCGHITSNNIVVSQAQGVHGNTVTQMLIDVQSMDNTLGGVGMVAMFYFNEAGDQIDIEYYSTVKDMYYKSCNQRTVDLNARCDAPTTGWDGYTMEKPDGAGTAEQPYLISSGAHLYWMAKELIYVNAETGKNAAPPSRTQINPFADSYFVQTNHINLNGYPLPSIGYYYQRTNTYAVFGGTYDGNGYTIKSATISNPVGLGSNNYWAAGLFGTIYGATIRNVVLDHITSTGGGSIGVLVGRAAAEIDGTADFNVIENCTVRSTCSAIGTKISMETPAAKYTLINDVYTPRIGGIVGTAVNTTIRSCINEAQLYAPGCHAYIGGIAGILTYHTVVDSCTNRGTITVDFTVSTTTREGTPHVNGGIVGGISGTSGYFGSGDGEDLINFRNKSTAIINCENRGNFALLGIAPQEVYYGGILGHSYQLADGYTCIIKNCNTTGGTITVGSQTQSIYLAGVVGLATNGTAGSCSPLQLDSCTSASISAEPQNVDATTHTVSNAYIYASATAAPLSVAHTYSNWEKIDDATHSAVCGCGCNATLTLAHNWNEKSITTSATHLTVGEMTYTCVDCGATKTAEIPKTATHSFGAWIKTDADTHTGSCACGKTRTHNHLWGEGVETQAATHDTVGIMTYTCLYCSATKTEDISTNGAHTFGTWIEHTVLEHKKTCGCGEVVYGAHNWDEGVASTPATHTAEGVMTYTCNDCDAIKTEVIPKPQGHSFGSAWQEHNDLQHKHVCACGAEEYQDHNWDEGVVSTPATHTAEGAMTYTCNDCDAIKTEAIAKIAEHAFGEWQKHNGTQHKRVCTCGAEECAAHIWDAGSITTEATEETAGVRTYTCSGCDETKTEDIPAIGSASADSDSMNNDHQSGNDATADESKGLPVGAVVGIALGAIVLGCCGGFAGCRLLIKKKKSTI